MSSALTAARSSGGSSTFNHVLQSADKHNWLSGEHFSVDGTLIQAWASHKSFVRKDGSDGDQGGGSFKGQSRSNETHESATDADARLYRKGKTASELRFMGHTLGGQPPRPDC